MNSLFLITALLFNIIVYFQHTRRAILAYSGTSTLLFGLYNFAAVGITAGIICCVLLGNTVFQYSHTDTDLDRTRMKRLATAAIAAVAGTLLFANSGADALPLMAFLLVCFAETSSRTATIYLLYLLSVLIWVVFALAHNDYLYAGANTIIFLINALVCIQHFLHAKAKAL
jgi:hypothetical protein